MTDPSPSAAPLARLPSGIPGLDTILAGGLFRGGSYLVTGLPGTGKTILANQLAFHQIAAGGRVVSPDRGGPGLVVRPRSGGTGNGPGLTWDGPQEAARNTRRSHPAGSPRPSETRGSRAAPLRQRSGAAGAGD